MIWRNKAILSAVLAMILAASPVRAADNPEVSVGVLKFGTVNWLMDVISSNGLDVENGYKLALRPLAGKPATTIALQSGDVDMIVTDWPWAMRQRAEGVDYVFSPYSTTLGAVMTAPAAGIGDICDLKGRRIGVVGGPLDKSWLLLQALTKEQCGFDLAAEAEALFGAPPLLSRQLTEGAVDAVSTFWHFAARLEAGGMTRLIGAGEMMASLGVTPPPPLIGFVWSETTFKDRADALAGFLASAEAANALLRSSDAEWERLRPLMRAKSDAEFEALRDRYREGAEDAWTDAHAKGAETLHNVLIRIGGDAYLGKAGAFDGGVFAGAD